MLMKTLKICIILFIFASCKIDKSKSEIIFRHLLADTSESERAKKELAFSNRSSEYLNLSNIFNGVDSFEFRIWSFGFWTRSDLFILKFSKGVWLSYNYIYYDNGKTIDSLHMFSNVINKDSAFNFAKSLCADSLLNLPTQISIPNFEDNTADGETYYIEIATKDFYKLLSYHNPQYFTDKSNKQFLRLIDKIKENYKIHYPY